MGARTPPAQPAHWRFTTTDDVTPQVFATTDIVSQRQTVVRVVASLPTGAGPSGDTMDLEVGDGVTTIAFSIPDGDDAVIVDVASGTVFDEGNGIVPEIVDDGGVTLAPGDGLVFGYDYL